MSIRLIYHTPISAAGGVSPFDEALLDIAEGSDLRIACPYLNVGYLARLTRRAKHWRLVTDVEAWLTAQDKAGRQRVLTSLATNPDRIRHYPDLHAKVVIGRQAALVGSANLTHRGIRGRVEMATHLTGEECVEELGGWFEQLWSTSTVVPLAEAERFAAALPAERHPSPDPLTTLAPKVRAELRSVEVAGGKSVEAKIIERCRSLPNKLWARRFFELAGSMVEASGLTAVDPRLAMTLPDNTTFGVTINRRYVLCTYPARCASQHKFRLLPGRSLGREEHLLGLLMLASWEPRPDQPSELMSSLPYKPSADGEVDVTAPRLAVFRTNDRLDLTEDVLKTWETTCRVECDHGDNSRVRKFNEEALYRMATDVRYREAILTRAFPDDG